MRRIGAEVRAKINCGQRSLGYVLFGDVVVVQSRVEKNTIDRSGDNTGVALGGGIFDITKTLTLDHTKVEQNLANGVTSNVQHGF